LCNGGNTQIIFTSSFNKSIKEAERKEFQPTDVAEAIPTPEVPVTEEPAPAEGEPTPEAPVTAVEPAPAVETPVAVEPAQPPTAEQAPVEPPVADSPAAEQVPVEPPVADNPAGAEEAPAIDSPENTPQE